ncbi:MAG: NPCBM/NEW2 domain-containing protein [Clostridia bacterium]|nr:NPCBM/NEW2 domain-containing protein [Clostridia bacterium]
MKKAYKKILICILAGIVLTSGVVFAKQAMETINVYYDNIKILIDGIEYHPTDAHGETVEPFIYNGTTYLPVRAIANAFGKDVDWQPQTSIVTLGSNNYDWLDQMGYVDYYSSTKNDKMYAIAENTEMTDKSKYDRGLRFFLCDHQMSASDTGVVELEDGTLECAQTVTYLLNNQYNTFEGTIAGFDCDKDASALIRFYGDGELIYTSPIISAGTKSTKFNIPVDGYKLLKIRTEIVNPTCNTHHSIEASPCIAEARLSKK